MSGRQRLPGGAPRKASQRKTHRQAPITARIAAVWRSGDTCAGRAAPASTGAMSATSIARSCWDPASIACRPGNSNKAARWTHCRPGIPVRAPPPSDLLDQFHLRAVGCGNPAHMPTVVEALFQDLRAVFLKVREGAGVIVGLDRDVLDADMLLMVLVGVDRCHVELHAVQVELAAAAGSFPLHGRPEIDDVELCDLLRILFGLDVDVPELHGHASLLRYGFAQDAPRRRLPLQLGSTSR